jgi:hypothetical protein
MEIIFARKMKLVRIKHVDMNVNVHLVIKESKFYVTVNNKNIFTGIVGISVGREMITLRCETIT